MSPVLNCPPVAVSVCVTESLLVTLIVAPGSTLAAIGSNMKLEIVMAEASLAEPEPEPLCLEQPRGTRIRRCYRRPGAEQPQPPVRPLRS